MKMCEPIISNLDNNLYHLGFNLKNASYNHLHGCGLYAQVINNKLSDNKDAIRLDIVSSSQKAVIFIDGKEYQASNIVIVL